MVDSTYNVNSNYQGSGYGFPVGPTSPGSDQYSSGWNQGSPLLQFGGSQFGGSGNDPYSSNIFGSAATMFPPPGGTMYEQLESQFGIGNLIASLDPFGELPPGGSGTGGTTQGSQDYSYDEEDSSLDETDETKTTDTTQTTTDDDTETPPADEDPVTPIDAAPDGGDPNVSDGFINTDTKQQSEGDCVFLSVTRAIGQTGVGRAEIKQAIKSNSDGSYDVKLKGSDKSYHVTADEAKQGQFAGGDIDMQVLGVAADKYFKEQGNAEGVNGKGFTDISKLILGKAGSKPESYTTNNSADDD